MIQFLPDVTNGVREMRNAITRAVQTSALQITTPIAGTHDEAFWQQRARAERVVFWLCTLVAVGAATVAVVA